MDCTLFIPHLLPPSVQGDALWRAVDAPQLKSMLARAALTVDPASDVDTWLCRTFGIARQQDFPLSPLLAVHESLAAGSGYWLCATPVHLETRRNALVLSDPATLEIAAEESAAFATTLAGHLREENITLHAPRPGRWFLRSDATPAMSTSSLATVIGRDVRPYLPQGKDSARWHRMLTEIQMLLHSHPVNDLREARGLLPVNSVWLWGGGTLPPPATAPFATVWSDDFVINALAHHSGCARAPPLARITPDKLKEGSHLLSCALLDAPMRRGDAQAWSNAVAALNGNWFVPLITALKARRLQSLTVVSANQSGVRTFVARPHDAMKFWHKNKYLQ